MIFVALATVLAASPTMALDPPQPLSEQVHTGWSLKEAAPSAIWRITQTPQGDLWLGSGQGVFRFDGARFVQLPLVGSAAFANDMINDLFVDARGDLWIGYHGGGVSRLRDGKLQAFAAGLPPGPVKRIGQGKDGAIWVAAFGGVAVFRQGVWKTLPWDESFGRAFNLVVARDGVVWVAAQHALVYVRPGADVVRKSPEPVDESWALAEGPDGRIWISDVKWGVRALEPRQLLTARTALPLGRPREDALRARAITFDREGALWASQQQETGLFRVFRPGRLPSNRPLRPDDADEVFRSQDGLTSSTAAPLFEDREGNMWVGTELGLDRFRRADVNVSNTIAKDSREGYRAVTASDGAFYVADEDTIYRADASAGFRKIARDPWHPDEFCAGRDGVVWLTDRRGLRRFVNGRMSTVRMPAAARKGEAYTCAEDTSGALWLSVLGVGLFTYHDGVWRGPLPLALPKKMFPRLLVAERKGGVWAFDRGHGLHLIKDGHVRTFGAAEGLEIGDIATVVSNDHGTFAGGELGLARLNGDRFVSLAAQTYPNLGLISGVTQDADGDTWLSSIHGVIRLRAGDMERALAHPGAPLPLRRFDFRDGVPGMAQQKCCHGTAFTGRSDRVWFITSRGVAWIDPKRLTFNALPPPVLIRSVAVNGRALPPADQMRLPPSVSDLHFDFAAPSLAIPERVRFLYRLEGVDADWVDPGDRRQAFYTRLAPGRYRFRVIAANNDGVWNRTGASVAFVVPPTFVQTRLFVLLCTLVGVALLTMAYLWRSRQIADRLRDRLEAQLKERERIARDLHDTLLQGLQGLVLRFGAIAEAAPRESDFRHEMDDALRRGEQIIGESRDHILALRNTSSSKALTEQFERIGVEFESRSDTRLIVAADGECRDLTAPVLEEVGKIGCEAIRNAFDHARARTIVAETIYDPDTLRLVVHDDGLGLPDDILRTGSRAGHFGLPGMRERARRIGGRLSLTNQEGLRVELCVPARMAYEGRARAWERRRLMRAGRART